MKPRALRINTSRGALIDSQALIVPLKTGHPGGAGLHVYEEEDGIFSRTLSGQGLHDDIFARLLTLPNFIVTGHQGFFTREALMDIATGTIDNITGFEARRRNADLLVPAKSSHVA